MTELIELTKDIELAKVSATFSMKKQVKQFEPVDASCSITETCKKEEVEETYERLYETCKKLVLSKIEKETGDTAKIALIEADKKLIAQSPESKPGEGGLPF